MSRKRGRDSQPLRKQYRERSGARMIVNYSQASEATALNAGHTLGFAPASNDVL